MIKAVLFDLDGTTLDTVGDIRLALNKTLHTDFTDSDVNGFVGNGLRNLIVYALQSLGKVVSDSEIDALFKELIIHYRECPVMYTKPYPGIPEMLHKLNDLGIKVGIFSNKEQDLAETVVHECLKGIKIDFLAGRNGKYRAKPDTEAVFAFCDENGISIDELLYVGDSEVDYKTGRDAGCKTLIITWGTRTPEKLSELGVDASCFIKDASDVLKYIEEAVVVTITETMGSSPRKSGASMAVLRDGSTIGTIGGGNLEKICIEKALRIIDTKESSVEIFNLDDVEMICGGKTKIEFSYRESFSETDFKSKSATRVVLFGGGHVGKELVPLLNHLGFKVCLFDDRPEFASHKRHPYAFSCSLCDYADIGKSVSIDKDDFVVIMTHGHAGDRDVLLQVCRKNPAYIGCIGSRKKVSVTQQYLRENGVSEDVILSVHSPIGIEIYGDTPEEIAVSVAAELIKTRAVINGLDKS